MSDESEAEEYMRITYGNSATGPQLKEDKLNDTDIADLLRPTDFSKILEMGHGFACEIALNKVKSADEAHGENNMKRVEEIQDEYNSCKDKARRTELVKAINLLLFGAEGEAYG